MIQGIRRLASVDTEHNLLHETLARNALGLIPVVATDSSTITRDTLPANYAQYYTNGSTNRLYININNSIISVDLSDSANIALSNLSNVAINTSLISDADSTNDLGSSTKFWSKTYTDNVVFPVSVISSADPNTLDDYEEGTWTVAITGSSSGTWNVDSNTDTGGYIIIGGMCHIQGRISVSSESSPVGEINISLPFTPASLTEEADTSGISLAIWNHGGTISQTHGLIAGGNSTMRIVEIADNGTQTVLSAGDVDTVWEIRFSGAYRIS